MSVDSAINVLQKVQAAEAAAIDQLVQTLTDAGYEINHTVDTVTIFSNTIVLREIPEEGAEAEVTYIDRD